jgi:polyisoprenoid-binding protein YceI
MESSVHKVAVMLAGIAIGVVGHPTNASERYAIDPDHVWVNFSIQQYVYSKALGRFTGISGEITFDKDHVENSSVKAEIDANTADTANAERDINEVRPQFLKGDKFPKITFVSTGIEKTGDNTGKVTGDLTLAGVTKSVTMDVTFNGAADSMFTGIETVGFSAKGTLSASDFMIDGLTTLKLGPSVDFTIEVQATKE